MAAASPRFARSCGACGDPGVVVVVACGNEGQLEVQTRSGDIAINTPMSIGDPANLEDCIAVGSVNADRPHLYGVSPFSSRGPDV